MVTFVGANRFKCKPGKNEDKEESESQISVEILPNLDYVVKYITAGFTGPAGAQGTPGLMEGTGATV